ncbi:MAG: hypothetical protein II571_05430 [Lachnospiraceae bacterium]|nr:hypothetical protein [Lachnospiraceae bacterium]MBQ1609017.1 hypothetical protein [Lachnospiraceae bacterium]MBQ1641001.1 hypothetical protein [Lachnospiraceae bacterium]MBQ1720908.1 hypothetical protein [Lachnospiraceae bacterium]MBQ2317584.1 hypothetical protein [Lachnospiraceae bacterium]
MATNQKALEEREQQAVDYIKANANLSDLAVVEKIYQQLSKQGTFQTAIGLGFLQELETLLLPEEEPEPEVSKPTVKMYTKEEVVAELKKAKTKQQKKVQILTVSTVILAIMVVVMLGISMTSKLPTVLNYKDMVTDEYASWETELRNREEEVRRREQELLEKESQYVESMDRQNQEQQTHYDTEDMDSLEEEDTGEDTEAENLVEE